MDQIQEWTPGQTNPRDKREQILFITKNRDRGGSKCKPQSRGHSKCSRISLPKYVACMLSRKSSHCRTPRGSSKPSTEQTTSFIPPEPRDQEPTQPDWSNLLGKDTGHLSITLVYDDVGLYILLGTFCVYRTLYLRVSMHFINLSEFSLTTSLWGEFYQTSWSKWGNWGTERLRAPSCSLQSRDQPLFTSVSNALFQVICESKDCGLRVYHHTQSQWQDWNSALLSLSSML